MTERVLSKYLGSCRFLRAMGNGASAMDRVSVIMPTFNSGLRLLRAIESVLSQTHSALELIICDDCSTDSTASRAEGVDDPRVTVLSTARNSGSAAVPRNLGLRQARGEWLAFLDHDDRWSPDKLEIQLRCLREQGCKAASTDAWRQFPDERDEVRLIGGEDRLFGTADLLGCNTIVCSSSMFHASLCDVVEGFSPGVLYSDYALWLRVSCCTQFAYTAQPLVDYLDDPANSVRAKAGSESVELRKVLDDFAGWLARARPRHHESIAAEVDRKICSLA